MSPVIIESPFAGCVPLHRAYLQACIRDCLTRGETPYASHQMITDALDDLKPEERERGIAAGLKMAEFIVENDGGWAFYEDLGWSSGMHRAWDASRRSAWADVGHKRELGDVNAIWDRIIDDAVSKFADPGEKAKILHLCQMCPHTSEREVALYIKAHWGSAVAA